MVDKNEPAGQLEGVQPAVKAVVLNASLNDLWLVLQRALAVAFGLLLWRSAVDEVLQVCYRPRVLVGLFEDLVLGLALLRVDVVVCVVLRDLSPGHNNI